MNWIPLKSEHRPQVIFKHSIRCGTSSIAKNRLESHETLSGADFYFLDIIRQRNISNAIANQFGIEHESPQILVIKKGACIYNESHYGIEIEEIKNEI